MLQQYTLDYFINKFSVIPEENWVTKVYHKFESVQEYPYVKTVCCALGHCGVRNFADAGSNIYDIPEGVALRDLIDEYFSDDGIEITDINDGFDIPMGNECNLISLYPFLALNTPKQRVLGALEFIKRLNEK